MEDPFDWLARQIARFGFGRVISAPVVLLGAISGLTAIFGSPITAVIAALGIAAFELATFLALALLRVRRLESELADFRWAMESLRRFVLEEHQAQFRYELWREEIEVNKAGDATFFSTIEVVVDGASSPLHFLDYKQGGEALTEKERRQVRFTAKQEPGGLGLPVMVEWESPRQARFWIHFPVPIDPGGSTTLVLEFEWPHTLPGLSRGGRETMTWECITPTDRFEVELVLDKSCGRDRPFGYAVDGLSDGLDQRRDAKMWRVAGWGHNLPSGTRLSLTLDAG